MTHLTLCFINKVIFHGYPVVVLRKRVSLWQYCCYEPCKRKHSWGLWWILQGRGSVRVSVFLGVVSVILLSTVKCTTSRGRMGVVYVVLVQRKYGSICSYQGVYFQLVTLYGVIVLLSVFCFLKQLRLFRKNIRLQEGTIFESCLILFFL